MHNWAERLRQRWQKWRLLSWSERLLFSQALFLLSVIAVALRLFSFKRVYATLSRPLPQFGNTHSDQRSQQALSTAALVQAATYVVPFAATCLPRSLTLWLLLRRQGIVSELQIGVQKASGDFAAHAWVEYEGVVLNDSADIGQRFVAFDQISHF